jgi:hypothetical protein
MVEQVIILAEVSIGYSSIGNQAPPAEPKKARNEQKREIQNPNSD